METDLLAFSAQQTVKGVSCYHQSGFITQWQQNYHSMNAESSFARKYILRWARNFDKLGRVEHAQVSGKTWSIIQPTEKVSKYFFQYSWRSLQKAEKDLRIPRSSTHFMLWDWLHTFPYKLHILHKLKDHDFSSCIYLSNSSLQNI